LHFLLHATSLTHSYPLSLHDALPISSGLSRQCLLARPHLADPQLAGLAGAASRRRGCEGARACDQGLVDVRAQLARRAALSGELDRKSTRLNSSHVKISYAVFCLKKK